MLRDLGCWASSVFTEQRQRPTFGDEPMINGEKVALREKSLSDAPNDYEWRCDPELARLDGVLPAVISFPEFMKSYEQELLYPSRHRRRFAIDTLEGKHIGNCMYYDVDDERAEAELGIMIGHRDYWDKGYGTDAVTTLVNHIFSETSMERIYLHTLDLNLRAQRCFHKCGFVPCGSLKRHGGDFVVMELRRIWREKSAGKPLRCYRAEGRS